MSGPADLSSSAEKAALFCPPPLPPRLETQTEDAPTAARTAQTRRPPPPSAVAAPQKPEHSGPLLRAEAAAGGALGAEGQDALSLQSALESLLFVADAPVEAAQLARAVHTAVEQVEAALRGLEAGYQAAGRGLRLAERNGRFQLVTVPAAAPLIESFLTLEASARLSGPALETLAIVAYRQPVTRAQIEAVRGVDCSGLLRSLLQRGLLEEFDRLDVPGRPVRYGVTELFIHHFGLTRLQELPPLERAEDEQLDTVLAPEEP